MSMTSPGICSATPNRENIRISSESALRRDQVIPMKSTVYSTISIPLTSTYPRE